MKPNITEYMDIHFFLKDYFEFKKKEDENFSYSEWARILGFNNRVLLRMMITGQRKITTSAKERFEKYFHFSKTETEYFHLLIDYANAPSLEKKSLISKQMTQLLKHFHLQVAIPETSNITKSHLGPLVLILLSIESLDRSLRGLQKILGAETSAIKTTLDQLIFEDLASFDGHNYGTKVKSFKIKDNLGNQGLRDLHDLFAKKSMLAQDADPNTRRYRSLVMNLSPSEYAHVCEMFNDCAEKIMAHYGSSSSSDSSLYVFYNSLFPLLSADKEKPRET